MNKIYEVKTIEEAYDLAKNDFHFPIDELKFEVLSEKKGFLGIGSKLEVQASLAVDPFTKGKEYLQVILDANNINAVIEKKVRDDVVEYDIEAGDENGYLIGKRSRSLIAMQILVSHYVNRYFIDSDKQISVLVDVGEYKKKRVRYLERLAIQFGKQVAKTKQKIKLDYLNAYERKIVHSKLATWDDIKTYSEGEEPNRFLIIEPK
ncbi:MAG: Jag N-terminal domain-containing protein [Bacilli bacterium]|jgi:spoIIIJ-associated protein|nr:Jag N-terminal domain-containing protein [Bacilli bacterium]MDD2682334.1 Jag N-terminal domain-containing protein [Bacilli bacterium]MDD3120778.1 Jag N-terminal domain-containing protein [Bacilli bacterium]MDD4063835.1 Jag N-terminal domain-containing protein [Bacilli bacterium]MDD5182862.1 Jag N-terminal domain-containing protein [Bacilli bacterium]